MTDRIRTLHVTLSHDFRDDDVESVVSAIQMVKGVQSVVNGPVVNIEDHLNREAFRSDVLLAAMDFFRLACFDNEGWLEIKELLKKKAKR